MAKRYALSDEAWSVVSDLNSWARAAPPNAQWRALDNLLG